MSMRRTPEWYDAHRAKRAKAVAKADGLSNVELVNKTWLGDMPIPTYLAPVPTLTEAVKHEKDLYHFVTLCVAGGFPAPRCEYEFCLPRKYRFDYAFPANELPKRWLALANVAVEIDGGIWRKGGGAHSHPSNIERDIEKMNLAAKRGWRVLRYAPEDIGNAIDDLTEMLS